MNTAYFGDIKWYGRLLAEMRQHPDASLHEIIDGAERWQKQTERNRCSIVTANGVQMLSVPVTVPSNRCRVDEVMVSNHGNWQHVHWNAICSAYGMSPFFEFYADDIEPLFRFQDDHLFSILRPGRKTQDAMPTLYDYNLAITSKILELLNVTKASLKANVTPPAVTGEYYQTFQRRHGFIPGMSILDLLFNMGNESLLYILHNGG